MCSRRSRVWKSLDTQISFRTVSEEVITNKNIGVRKTLLVLAKPKIQLSDSKICFELAENYTYRAYTDLTVIAYYGLTFWNSETPLTFSETPSLQRLLSLHSSQMVSATKSGVEEQIALFGWTITVLIAQIFYRPFTWPRLHDAFLKHTFIETSLKRQ